MVRGADGSKNKSRFPAGMTTKRKGLRYTHDYLALDHVQVGEHRVEEGGAHG